MQSTSSQSANTPGSNNAPIEDDLFWQNHEQQLAESRLSRRAYCQKHGVNYDRFQYHRKKLATRQTERCIPIKMKERQKKEKSQSCLCVIELKKGDRIVIYDTKVLSELFERIM